MVCNKNKGVVKFVVVVLFCILGLQMIRTQDNEKSKKNEKPKKQEKQEQASEPVPVPAVQHEVSKNKALFPGNDPAFLILPKPAERRNMAKELLNSETEEMTDKILKYLADSQAPDGSWSDLQYRKNSGVTAVCCMAFMSQGSRPRIGMYGQHLDKGLDFIVSSAQSNGLIASGDVNPLGPMYEHIMSSLALMMAYGDMPWRPQVRDILGKSVQLISKSQKLDGGWRFDIGREGYSDVSVTGNVLWLLRTAKKAGFSVSAESINKGVKYIVDCAYPDGNFRYRYAGLQASPSLGGVGMIALFNNGNLNHPLIGPARDKIAYDYQRYTPKDLSERRYFLYGCFYASVAMYSSGDQYWFPWYKKVAQILKFMQRDDGELWDEYGNTIYPSAMAAMILQAPKGYLPLYE